MLIEVDIQNLRTSKKYPSYFIFCKCIHEHWPEKAIVSSYWNNDPNVARTYDTVQRLWPAENTAEHSALVLNGSRCVTTMLSVPRWRCASLTKFLYTKNEDIEGWNPSRVAWVCTRTGNFISFATLQHSGIVFGHSYWISQWDPCPWQPPTLPRIHKDLATMLS